MYIHTHAYTYQICSKVYKPVAEKYSDIYWKQCFLFD